MRTKFSILLLIVTVIAGSYFSFKTLVFAAGPGCMDAAAINYNASATEDDGSCYYFTFNNPAAGSTQIFWTPSLAGWSSASVCEYSYDGVSYSALSCANQGADIPAPSAAGAVTLYAKTNLSTTSTSTAFTYAPSATWAIATNVGSRSWSYSHVSSNGSRMTVLSGSYVYGSTDSGATWTQKTSSSGFSTTAVGIGAPDDQSYLIVTRRVAIHAPGAAPSYYMKRSIDGGATWSDITDTGRKWWYEVAISADGQKIAVTADKGGDAPGDYITLSSDGGTTWSTSTASGQKWWRVITSSSDGSKIVAGVPGEYLYRSSDSGTTWATSTTQVIGTWRSLSSSADGSRVVASGIGSGYVYLSSDYGDTWATSTLPSAAWLKTASSGDGSRLIAVKSDAVYISNDYGATWTEQTDLSGQTFSNVSISRDGTKALLSASGYLFVGTLGATTPTSSTPSTDDGDSGARTGGSGGGGGGGSSYFVYTTSATTTASTSTSVATSTIKKTPESKFVFLKNLRQGSRGIDVTELQKYLNRNGFRVSAQRGGSPGLENDYFGKDTFAAVKRFQAANKIPSTGFFGPITRGFINSR